jgi:Tfp pilus assembly protein PilN
MTEQLTEKPGEATAEPAAPGPTRVAWAMVPRVNLLPVEIMEGRQFRRTKVLLGAGVLSTLLIAGAGMLWAQQDVADANDQLSVAQAKVTALNAQKARYAEVPKVLAELDAARTARTLAMGSDVLWYRYLNDLDGARPTGVVLSAFTLTLVKTDAVASPPSDPLSSHGVGTLAVSGSAATYQQVASWLEALDKISGLSSSFLSNVTKVSDLRVTFGSGAVINSDAFSHRYDKKGS